MRLDAPPRKDPHLVALLEADADGSGEDAELVASCHEEEPTKTKPLRVLAWHVDELGGGFHRARERPEHATLAYAKLVVALDVDIVVLLGVTRTVGDLPVASDGCLKMDPEPEDTGAAEVARLVEQLGTLDGGAGWTARFPADGGTHAYHLGATTCILHRTSTGISAGSMELAPSSVDPAAGSTGIMVCASFDAPQHRPEPVWVVAPLGVQPVYRSSLTLPNDALKTPAKLPDSALVFVSAPQGRGGGPASLRGQLGAMVTIPRDEGTMLRLAWWERATKSDAVLADFTALNLADVLLQDQQMHWEALPDPAHGERLDDVAGIVRDVLMVCHAAADGEPTIDELRVVDLVRASLSASSLEKLETKPKSEAKSEPAAQGAEAPASEFPSEDGVLQPALLARRALEKNPAKESAAANELAEAAYFCLDLSTHWPVVAQVHYPSTKP